MLLPSARVKLLVLERRTATKGWLGNMHLSIAEEAANKKTKLYFY
jgi:hypothetical protein